MTTCSATLNGDSLSLKQGIRTRTTEVSKLRYLYVCRHENRPDELLLSYEKAPGKNKTLRVYGNSGEAGMQAFIVTLAGLRPDIDIRHMDEKTAHKTLGATRTQWVGAVVAFVSVIVVVGVIMLPLGLHGIDHGKEHVTIEQLDSGYEPSTHNVVIRGSADIADALVDRSTSTYRGSTTTTTRYYVPLVPDGWRKTDPVHVVLETGQLGLPAQLQLATATEFPGIIRDIMWEGLGRGDRKFFTSRKVGIQLADDVKLVDFLADPRTDLYEYAGIMGGLLILLTSVIGYRWVRKRA